MQAIYFYPFNREALVYKILCLVSFYCTKCWLRIKLLLSHRFMVDTFPQGCKRFCSTVITYLSVPMGPLSSIVSPITLIILPNVSGPTGIVIGPPVSLHTCPLTRPSVPSIAMVRTVFSPNKDQTKFTTGLQIIGEWV